MILGLLTLITALSISAVAIYYSVAGLMAIFAAAALPIMIMGGVLEISKLVTAVWLHRYWKQATWWLKTYLTSAVLVLMLITSMGIFGFLSKAHIEQTSASTESLARVTTIESEIARNNAIVERAENRIKQLENSETGSDANVQSQIDKEQERIDSAYSRIQPAIDEQNKIIAGVTALYQQELDRIDQEVATLQGYIDNGETKKAQQMIGASADGIFGKNTAEKIGDWQAAKRAERAEWLTKIQDAANSPTVVAARDEITRLRSNAEQQIANSNTLINRLRSQLGSTDNADQIQKDIDEQQERIRTASSEIETLTDEKITLEAQYRKLEAEVGPIKYIAEFIYGNTADNTMLEEAVRWVIITIIFVFDPLAVLLLIASQYTFEFRKRKDDDGGWLRQYEQARAQRIVDNPGFTADLDKETPDENNRTEDREEESQDAEELRPGQDQESVPSETGDDPVVAETKELDKWNDWVEAANKAAEEERETDAPESTTTTDDDSRELVSEADTSVADAPDQPVEQPEVQTDETVEPKKKDTSSVTAESSEQSNKVIPDTRNRMFYPEELSTTYVMKDKDKQVEKETTGYVQNEEQGTTTLWDKLKKDE